MAASSQTFILGVVAIVWMAATKGRVASPGFCVSKATLHSCECQGMVKGFRDNAGQSQSSCWQHTMLCWPTGASWKRQAVLHSETPAPASPKCALANDLQGSPAAACHGRLMLQQVTSGTQA